MACIEAGRERLQHFVQNLPLSFCMDSALIHHAAVYIQFAMGQGHSCNGTLFGSRYSRNCLDLRGI
mgnify:CR=1 FL=1